MESPALTPLENEHHYLRQALPLLDEILKRPERPPLDSREFRLLEGAASYFRHELSRHIRHEEKDLFPTLEPLSRDPRLLETLKEEHEEILVYVRAFESRVQDLRSSSDTTQWAALRHLTQRFQALLLQHMATEQGKAFPLLRPEPAELLPG